MKILILVLQLVCAVAWADNKSVLGKWKTIDDETGKPKSIVEIVQDGETVSGRVLEILNPEEPDPVCKECKGDKKDKPIKGLEIMWGLKETTPGVEWTGGEIMDPKNGKTYRCKIKLVENGEKLDVRGFLGFAFIGRTQTWIREQQGLAL